MSVEKEGRERVDGWRSEKRENPTAVAKQLVAYPGFSEVQTHWKTDTIRGLKT